MTLGIVYIFIFKFYLHSQTFRVRKIVSTRYNLLDQEYSSKYETLRPSLSLNSQIYQYNEQDIGIINESNKMAPPSIEELEKAKQYQNYIPNYQLNNTEGSVIVGNMNNEIINDIPSQSYDNTENNINIQMSNNINYLEKDTKNENLITYKQI